MSIVDTKSMSGDDLDMAHIQLEERINTITHGLGLLLSIAGLVVAVVFASLYSTTPVIVACSVHGASLILLYAASTAYHGVPDGRIRDMLQVADHTCIYLLIAGTYTPFTLGPLRDGVGWPLFAITWGIAAIGVTKELALPCRSRWLSVVLYLVLGWLCVIAIVPLARNVSGLGMTLLVLGGLSYTVGVYFFVDSRIRFNHAIWHLFVLAGSVLHFFAVMTIFH